MESRNINHAAAPRWKKRHARGYVSIADTRVKGASACAGDARTALMQKG
jgi:hypothetical protein